MLVAAAGLALSLGASGCAHVWEQGRPGAAEKQRLNSSLSVAAASAEAGQFKAAERLYTELSRHFPDAPEPRFGLGYLALRARDFKLADRLFAEAEQRSTTPAAEAEALIGAGRARLGDGDVVTAKARFLAAAGLAEGTGTQTEAWATNGLGVVATIEGDHPLARRHYEKAVKLSSSDPMITANLVRALAESGERDEARRVYAVYSRSHWLNGDADDLAQLLQEKREGMARTASNLTRQEKKRQRTTPASTTASDSTAASGSGTMAQIYAARTEAGAMAAWKRLSSAEEDLLGSLKPRIVKAEIAKERIFYRLRVGPLQDVAAAKRLCDLLKKRKRDCFVPNVNDKDARRRNTAVATNVLVQLYAARTEAGAMAAWKRLSGAEKDLLGPLAPRVVKVRIPDKGVFHRLFAGPLPDVTTARRLCALLKERATDCFVRVARPAANPNHAWDDANGASKDDGERAPAKTP